MLLTSRQVAIFTGIGLMLSYDDMELQLITNEKVLGVNIVCMFAAINF